MAGCLLLAVMVAGLLVLEGRFLGFSKLGWGRERGGGGYLTPRLDDWAGSEEFVSGTSSGRPANDPDVWTDGSLVRDDVAGFCCGGAGVFADKSGEAWFRRTWGHLELLPPEDGLGNGRCRLFWVGSSAFAVCSKSGALGGYPGTTGRYTYSSWG